MPLMAPKFISPAWTSLQNCVSVYLLDTSWMLTRHLQPNMSKTDSPKPSSSYRIPQINTWQLHGSNHSGQISWSHPDTTLSHTLHLAHQQIPCLSLCKVHPEFDYSSPCPGHHHLLPRTASGSKLVSLVLPLFAQSNLNKIVRIPCQNTSRSCHSLLKTLQCLPISV